ncbi:MULTISPECIES: hypothetical protein [unclassified Actinomyces]|uniref:hypothetical protein n=1 Tax=unclassified Actinomyces TaxID=2609248 RepID=UPI0020182948|nr:MULTISPECIES: hypothetical protein [unclassified Actinomyces]MCL3778495.1 hypothetical protein [Actinomyces sp. AC-20-1]MCL3789681.1 hypothetical protein [Actinomyces sp. 187325]MCL3792823.1 hypothetical protein [Actinomyces sp. 186855]MCL3795389.1 hypothetical protein [Actinomyces sp. 217892]
MPDRTIPSRPRVIRSAGLSFLLCLALAVASAVGAGLVPVDRPVHDYLLGLAGSSVLPVISVLMTLTLIAASVYYDRTT